MGQKGQKDVTKLIYNMLYVVCLERVGVLYNSKHPNQFSHRVFLKTVHGLCLILEV
jgi:hypothetical protein